MRRGGLWLCAFTSRIASRGPGSAAAEVLELQKQQHAADASADAHQPDSVGGVASSFRDNRLYSVAGDVAAAAGGDLEVLRRRLLYQSSYRGMHELDLILGAFARDCVVTADKPEDSFAATRLDTRAELMAYDEVLREFDNDLNHWLVELGERGDVVPPASLSGTAVPEEISRRGPVPQRLLENAAWAKLVAYLAEHKDRVVQFR